MIKTNNYKILNTLFLHNVNHMLNSELKGEIGECYVDNIGDTKTAIVVIGNEACFGYFGGTPNKEMLLAFKNRDMIYVPNTEEWYDSMKKQFSSSGREFSRYAMKPNKKFEKNYFLEILRTIPKDIEIVKINSTIYNEILALTWARDLVGSYKNFSDFDMNAVGYILKLDGKIISGASTYIHLIKGIEIEVDTHPDYRNKGLAKLVSAKLILDCLENKLYPSWDAHNEISYKLAKSLNYDLDFEYKAFEITEN